MHCRAEEKIQVKLSIKVPKCLNWLFVDKAAVRALETRASISGEAKTSKRWGNELASIEMMTTYEIKPLKPK